MTVGPRASGFLTMNGPANGRINQYYPLFRIDETMSKYLTGYLPFDFGK